MSSVCNLINRSLFLIWICVCVFFTIDTGAFLYPSLSQTLLGEILIAVLGIVSATCMLISSKKVSISVVDVFVVVWVLFLIMHSIFVANTEHYKLNYIISSQLLVLLLPKILKYRLISFEQLECGLLAMLMIQLVYICLQAIGIMEPYCTLYRLTGTGDNPNTAALLLAMCVPILIKRLKNSEHTLFFLSFLLLTILFLAILKCRTAYVGLLVIFAIQLFCTSHVQRIIKSLSVKKKAVSICIGILLITVVASSLYNMKKDSADGRLLVWKLSTQMIAEKPLGHGIGMFEQCYNLQQGEYFASGKGNTGEKLRSNIVCMAYNDILEQGVESGLIGASFMLSFYVLLLFKTYRIKDFDALSVICAFLVMSMVNFIYSSIQPWILFLAYASRVMAKDKELIEISNAGSLAIRFLTMAICACAIVYLAGVTLSQAKLKTESDKLKSGRIVDKKELYKLRETISTSSEYYLTMGRIETKCGKYEKALACFNEAAKYTSVPTIYFNGFKCLDKIGRTREGIEHIKTVSNILPQNLSSRVILLNWYHKQNEKLKALSIAHEIADMKVKVVNNKSEEIQRRALQYIHENE